VKRLKVFNRSQPVLNQGDNRCALPVGRRSQVLAAFNRWSDGPERTKVSVNPNHRKEVLLTTLAKHLCATHDFGFT